MTPGNRQNILLWDFMSSKFLKMHDVSEACSVSVIRQRST